MFYVDTVSGFVDLSPTNDSPIKPSEHFIYALEESEVDKLTEEEMKNLFPTLEEARQCVVLRHHNEISRLIHFLQAMQNENLSMPSMN